MHICACWELQMQITLKNSAPGWQCFLIDDEVAFPNVMKEHWTHCMKAVSGCHSSRNEILHQKNDLKRKAIQSLKDSLLVPEQTQKNLMWSDIQWEMQQEKSNLQLKNSTRTDTHNRFCYLSCPSSRNTVLSWNPGVQRSICKCVEWHCKLMMRCLAEKFITPKKRRIAAVCLTTGRSTYCMEAA